MTIDRPLRTDRDYAAQLEALLPPGPAWQFAPGGIFAMLLLALGAEFARVDGRGLDLVEEADPRTALELLPDWERVAALPDSCTGAPDSVIERQVAVHEKITGIGGQNRAHYIELAARLGYLIAIEEHHPARMGMQLGDRLNGPDWAFAWTVRVQPFDDVFTEESFVAQAQLGDRLGIRLRGFGALDIECVIRRAAPAHTTILFAYEVEPSPSLWIDFTA